MSHPSTTLEAAKSRRFESPRSPFLAAPRRLYCVTSTVTVRFSLSSVAGGAWQRLNFPRFSSSGASLTGSTQNHCYARIGQHINTVADPILCPQRCACRVSASLSLDTYTTLCATQPHRRWLKSHISMALNFSRGVGYFILLRGGTVPRSWRLAVPEQRVLDFCCRRCACQPSEVGSGGENVFQVRPTATGECR